MFHVLLRIDRADPQPLSNQVQQQLREAIRSGRLAAGERLPSSRALAQELGVSRGLIVNAYDQLHAEGYIITHPGSGVVVADGITVADHRPTPAAPRRPLLDVDFEYGIPDMQSFPCRDWAWALAQGCRTATTGDLGDDHSGGSTVLRGVLASYGRRVRASVIDPSTVIIVSGFRHGLNIVLAALANAGIKAVGLEDPGPLDHDHIARRCGLEPLDIPVDHEGINVDTLGRTRARAVIVTPAHHSPTGVLLSTRRRQQLIDWARAVDGYIIEDDYDAEFRYDRQPVGSLQGLAPERVIAMGSVSKTIAPAIRIGWIIAPPQLHQAVLTEHNLASRGAPSIEQLALAAFIDSGRFDRHLRLMRTLYSQRRHVLVDTLAEIAPDVTVTGLSAGCHAILQLPAGIDEQHVATQAAARRVGVYPLSRYRRSTTNDHNTPQLVAGFGNLTEHAIEHGLRTVTDLLQPPRPRLTGCATASPVEPEWG